MSQEDQSNGGVKEVLSPEESQNKESDSSMKNLDIAQNPTLEDLTKRIQYLEKKRTVIFFPDASPFLMGAFFVLFFVSGGVLFYFYSTTEATSSHIHRNRDMVQANRKEVQVAIQETKQIHHGAKQVVQSGEKALNDLVRMRKEGKRVFAQAEHVLSETKTSLKEVKRVLSQLRQTVKKADHVSEEVKKIEKLAEKAFTLSKDARHHANNVKKQASLSLKKIQELDVQAKQSFSKLKQTREMMEVTSKNSSIALKNVTNALDGSKMSLNLANRAIKTLSQMEKGSNNLAQKAMMIDQKLANAEKRSTEIETTATSVSQQIKSAIEKTKLTSTITQEVETIREKFNAFEKEMKKALSSQRQEYLAQIKKEEQQKHTLSEMAKKALAMSSNQANTVEKKLKQLTDRFLSTKLSFQDLQKEQKNSHMTLQRLKEELKKMQMVKRESIEKEDQSSSFSHK